MIITEGIGTGIEYFWRKSDSWDWFGVQQWWEIFVKFYGFNGEAGVWCEELWKWNGGTPGKYQFTQPRTLSYEDSAKMLQEIKDNQGSNQAQQQGPMVGQQKG